MNYLLDSSVFLWTCMGAPQLTVRVRDVLSVSDARLFVSAASGWEIALKSAKGKIQLPAPVQKWFSAVAAHHRIDVLPIEAATAIESTLLPPLHADPFDRLLAMIAIERKWILITPDETLKT
jgi:PIN domain nuclease of toxin-antitoxin system